MKLLLSTFFVLLVSQISFADMGQVSVKGGTWSFTTEGIKSTSESASGIGAYSVEVGYSFVSQVLFVFGMNFIMSDIYTGSAGYGFDLGAKYYPLTAAGTTELDSEFSEVRIQEPWRPYIGVFVRQRIFGLAISTSYLGPGLSMGVDYSIGKKWMISAEFRYDYLYGQGDALAIQNNFLLGVGVEF